MSSYNLEAVKRKVDCTMPWRTVPCLDRGQKRCTFKEELEQRLHKVYELITPEERDTLLIPVGFAHVPS